MRVRLIYRIPGTGQKLVIVGEHRLKFSAALLTGWCLTHHTFECEENLSDEEREAVLIAES